MFSLYDQLPRYLLGKYQLTSTVLFTVLFSLLFILVSIPFFPNAWFRLAGDQAFACTLSFFLASLTVLAFSKRMMYSVRNAPDLTFLKYFIWNFGEVIVVSLLYVFFTREAIRTGVDMPGEFIFEKQFSGAFVYTTVTLGVPYVVCGLYFAIQDKNNTIRLMNYGNVVSDIVLQPHEEKRITLFDNSGVLKFSINSENLYFIESDDNYIQVWYMDSSGGMKQYMLRCRLKTVEDSFTDSDLVRCHRKYMVNITKAKILTSDKDGYHIDLDIDSVDPIPVSKTYEQAVLARFNSR